MDEALEGGDGTGEATAETAAVETTGENEGGMGETTEPAEIPEDFPKPEEFLKNLGEQDPPKPLLMPPFLQDDELEAEEVTTSEVTSEVTAEAAPSEAPEEPSALPENPPKPVVSPQNETEGWAGKKEEEEEEREASPAAEELQLE